MARRQEFTNSFSAGEIANDLLMRSDQTFRNEGLKRARNIQIGRGGGFKRRPGTYDHGSVPADAIVRSVGKGLDATLLIFYVNGFREVDMSGSLIYEIVGAPWTTAAMVHAMQVAIEQDRVIVTSDSFFPRQLTRSAGIWTLASFSFAAGLSGSIKQPYWRYAPDNVTIAPSAYTGAVTVTASVATFSAAWVGYRLRYAGVELLVTAYTDTTHVTATVQGNLYPTISVTVADATGFTAGQQVQGVTSQVKGVVSQVTGATTLNVQLLGSYTYLSVGEKLIGPTSFSIISAVALNATPATSLDWDEAMISPARGYPGACALHHSRLLFGAFPNAKNALAGSAVGDVTDFDVGDGSDSNAIVDTIGSDVTLDIRHFGSSEQLLILTEAGPHYIPEQVAAPLSASNLELLQIGTEAAGNPTPVLATEGLMFCESKSGRLIIATPTGNVRRSWDIADLSELAYHLMGIPSELVLVAANRDTDRTVLVLRDDGQIAAMNYRRGQTLTSWALWTTLGEWRSITTADGRAFAISKRTIAGVTSYRLEEFIEGIWSDSQCPSSSDLTRFNGGTVGMWSDYTKLDNSAVAGGVVLTPPNPADYPLYVLGFDFTATAEIVPPIDGTMGLSRKSRITRAWLDVVASLNVRLNGYLASGFPSPTLGGVLPPYTGQLNFYILGRGREPTLTLTQTDGGPMEVRSLTMEVTS